jgi:hypothetical protein
VLRVVQEGESYRDIGHRLGLSKNTVLNFVKRDRAEGEIYVRLAAEPERSVSSPAARAKGALNANTSLGSASPGATRSSGIEGTPLARQVDRRDGDLKAAPFGHGVGDCIVAIARRAFLQRPRVALMPRMTS